jgi:hypothetical protein
VVSRSPWLPSLLIVPADFPCGLDMKCPLQKALMWKAWSPVGGVLRCDWITRALILING